MNDKKYENTKEEWDLNEIKINNKKYEDEDKNFFMKNYNKNYNKKEIYLKKRIISIEIIIIIFIIISLIGMGIIFYSLSILIAFNYFSKIERLRIKYKNNYSLKKLILNSIFWPLYFI
jgi:hypothetical protein